MVTRTIGWAKFSVPYQTKYWKKNRNFQISYIIGLLLTIRLKRAFRCVDFISHKKKLLLLRNNKTHQAVHCNLFLWIIVLLPTSKKGGIPLFRLYLFIFMFIRAQYLGLRTDLDDSFRIRIKVAPRSFHCNLIGIWQWISNTQHETHRGDEYGLGYY